MRSFLALALTAVFACALVGCQSDAPAPTPSGPGGVSGSPTKLSPTEEGKEGSSKESGVETAASKDQDKKETVPAGYNGDRLFQLSGLETTTLKIGNRSIEVWLMDTDSKRQEGMMFLTEKEVKPEQGMLFVFPGPQTAGRGFWMHNTVLPLDIAYISADKRVVHVVEGKPFDDTSLPSPADFQYVLELRKGGAAEYGVRKGATINIPSGVTAKD